jgi:hypothetical protein
MNYLIQERGGDVHIQQCSFSVIVALGRFERLVAVNFKDCADCGWLLWCDGTPTYAMLAAFANLLWPGNSTLQLSVRASGVGVFARQMLDSENTPKFFSKYRGSSFAVFARLTKKTIAEFDMEDARAYGNTSHIFLVDQFYPAYQLLNLEGFFSLVENFYVGSKESIKELINGWNWLRIFEDPKGTIQGFLRAAVCVANAILGGPVATLSADYFCEGRHAKGMIDFLVEVFK